MNVDADQVGRQLRLDFVSRAASARRLSHAAMRFEERFCAPARFDIDLGPKEVERFDHFANEALGLLR